MASLTLSAALVLVICLIFVSYAEGRFDCNTEEEAICRKYVRDNGYLYKDCTHIFYQRDCNPYCEYRKRDGNTGGRTLCSPEGQECQIGPNPKGKCVGTVPGKCGCGWS